MIEYIIGDGVKSIGVEAFFRCTNMKRVSIPGSVWIIMANAFYGCSGLTQVALPNSVTSVGSGAFLNCSNLTAPVYNEHVYAYMPPKICPESVTIPEGITLIAGNAFSKGALKSVTLPESLKEIGGGAFYQCTNLTNINFPNNIRSINPHAFTETGISTPLYNEYIYAYMPPSLLVTSVSIPEGIQVIAPTAFNRCSELQSVEVPNSVKKIGNLAFLRSGVKHISIGKNVSSIGTDAFFGCSHLGEIYNCATTPQSVVPHDFDGDAGHPAVDKTTCKLYVPFESLDAYKAANGWKDFTNIIGFDPNEGIEEVLANPEANGRKVLLDGQVLILRGDKTYTLTGQQLK